MDLPGLAVGLVALLQLLDDVRLARRRQQRRQPVFLREDVVDDRARLDHARPADEHRHAEAAFPGRALLAVERRRAAVRPGPGLGAVVGAVDHDGVVGDAEIIELLEQAADHVVVFDHAVGVEADAGPSLALTA